MPFLYPEKWQAWRAVAEAEPSLRSVGFAMMIWFIIVDVAALRGKVESVGSLVAPRWRGGPAAANRREARSGKTNIDPRLHSWGFDYVMLPKLEFIDSLLTGRAKT